MPQPFTDTSHLQPNVAEVAAKVMDGEAILINLSNGMYYSMDVVGGFVWQLLEPGSTIARMAEAVSRRYVVSRTEAAADLEKLAASLLDAGLIVIADTPIAAAGPEPDLLANETRRLEYAAPALNAYHDMAELLALDPPHPGLADTLSKPLDRD